MENAFSDSDSSEVDVVVVEDNEEDAQITVRGLRKIDPTPSIEIIVDGESAVEGLVESRLLKPRLVLLDLKLPKVHGLDVLEAMRSSGHMSDVPVVVLTSSDEPSDVLRAKQLGCTAYLTKPIDWTEYVELVCRTATRYLSGTTCPKD